MSGEPATKKEYILVSSENRAADSVSTTDFTLRMLVPITKVIKTDLIQVSMDYNVANIKAPDNEFTLGDGTGDSATTVVLEEGLYTVDVLAAWIQQQLTTDLGPGFSVYYGIDAKLMIEYVLQGAAGEGEVPANRQITTTSKVLADTLGLSSINDGTWVITPVTPSFRALDGVYGTYRWVFPKAVALGGIYPYLFIQSRALGTDIRVANGNLGFWRMLLNDQVNYSLTMVNNRVDSYTNTPITLQDIDIKLVYPDGTPVSNNGGLFTLLLEIVRLV